MEKAPIILFTYSRPSHTKNLLNSLAKNNEAKDSVLFIYCDGPKDGSNEETLKKIEEVRKIARQEKRFKEVIVKEQNKNKGLGTSIIDGVTEVVSLYGKVIVLEDDLILSPWFLYYMNDALIRYENHPNVGQIAGSNFFACGDKYPDFFFTPIPDCLGWGTWRNKWEHFNSNSKELLELLSRGNKIHKFNVYGTYDMKGMLMDQINGKVSSWAIRWQAVCVMNDWMILYPNPSMTNHVESDEATHANLNITPPLWKSKPELCTKEVKELPEVIKAMKLSYSGYGDYYGNLKKEKSFKYLRKRLSKFIRTIFQSQRQKGN
jgi:glycosyltransferase involved in cell wall biosynthesis